MPYSVGDVGGFGVVTANNWDCDLEVGIAASQAQYVFRFWLSRPRQWQDLGSNGNANLRGWFYARSWHDVQLLVRTH